MQVWVWVEGLIIWRVEMGSQRGWVLDIIVGYFKLFAGQLSGDRELRLEVFNSKRQFIKPIYL
jgi:hypothetical protein